MRTYQPHFLARYSRILSILEMDTMVAQQTHREVSGQACVFTYF